VGGVVHQAAALERLDEGLCIQDPGSRARHSTTAERPRSTARTRASVPIAYTPSGGRALSPTSEPARSWVTVTHVIHGLHAATLRAGRRFAGPRDG
jgi:hypothetical protein